MLASASSISSLVSQAAALSDRQTEIASELSAGTRLTHLSNDPEAAAATVRLSGDLAQTAGTLNAIQTVQSRMQAADGALAAAVKQLTSAVSLATGAANDTNSPADRIAVAGQLSSLRATLLALANSSYGGSNLFGGTALNAVPFQEDSVTGAVSYVGNDGDTTLRVGGAVLSTSASGSSLFGSGSGSVFAVLQDVVTTLQSGGAPTTAQVTAIRSSLQTAIDGRSALGSSASRLTDAGTYTTTQQANLKAALTAVAASDPVALATELSAAETQRSALLSSLATIGKTSLFDYLT